MYVNNAGKFVFVKSDNIEDSIEIENKISEIVEAGYQVQPQLRL